MKLLSVWDVENVLRLKHRVRVSEEVRLSVFNIFCTTDSRLFDVTSQTLENFRGLVQAVLSIETDVFCLVYAHARFIHRFLLEVQVLSQSSPFSIGDGWKTMQIFNISQIRSARALSAANHLLLFSS